MPPDVTRACAHAATVMTLMLGLGAVGCGTASAGPLGNVPGALEFGGLQRTYLLHAPSADPAGLVVNLHGAGMTGGEQAAVTNYDAVGDRHDFAVVYPDGIDYSWADGRGASVPDRTGVDDVGFLVALVEQISRDYGIDPGRVYATGMSAGGFMASRLACERADVVAAIAPVAGTLGSGFPCAPTQPVSVLEVHGTADPVVPFDGGPMIGRGGASDVVSAPELARRWEVIDGCPNPPAPDGAGVIGPGVQRVTASGCAGGTSVSLVRIDGGGHTWPGSRSSLPVEQVGITSSAFDASAASGQFFADHGR